MRSLDRERERSSLALFSCSREEEPEETKIASVQFLGEEE